jgi:hypothetical protein
MERGDATYQRGGVTSMTRSSGTCCSDAGRPGDFVSGPVLVMRSSSGLVAKEGALTRADGFRACARRVRAYKRDCALTDRGPHS